MGREDVRGQSSVEMLVLVAAILISVASLVYMGTRDSESTAAIRAARDGAENAIADLNVEFGCSIDIEKIGFDAGAITVYVVVRNAPPENFTWENFWENVVRPDIRMEALKYINNAVTGSFATVEYVRTSYHTYTVAVDNLRPLPVSR
jgi:hypothetical protein